MNVPGAKMKTQKKKFTLEFVNPVLKLTSVLERTTK